MNHYEKVDAPVIKFRRPVLLSLLLLQANFFERFDVTFFEEHRLQIVHLLKQFHMTTVCFLDFFQESFASR